MSRSIILIIVTAFNRCESIGVTYVKLVAENIGIRIAIIRILILI